MVRHHLPNIPIGVPGIAVRQAVWCCTGAPHGFGRQPHLELDVEAALAARARRVEVRQWGGVIGRPCPGYAVWIQGFERYDPWRDRSRKILREKWAERLVFPAL